MVKSKESKILVIYHGNCSDGFGAAWAIYQKLGSNNVEYHGTNYGQPLPSVVGRHVIMVDFSLSREDMEQVYRESASLFCLDHHKTAEEKLDGLPYCIFDMNRSGAGLAWDYFCGKDMIHNQFYMNTMWPTQGNELPRHWLINYIEDRDLWKNSLFFTEEVTSALRSYPMEFEVWDKIAAAPMMEMKCAGESILRFTKQMVNSLTEKAQFVTIGNYNNVPQVNSPVLQSEIGNTLLKKYPKAPFSCVYFIDKDNTIIVSLRSENGRVDVSEVARSYGGGGHRNAAGYKVLRGSPNK